MIDVDDLVKCWAVLHVSVEEAETAAEREQAERNKALFLDRVEKTVGLTEAALRERLPELNAAQMRPTDQEDPHA